MLCEFTVYDDDNFDPDDEWDDCDVEPDDEDYLENYVFNQEKEFTSRADNVIASLKHSLSSEGIAVKELDSWFIDGLKLLYAACFVDQFLNLDTTNFDRVRATLEAEVRERDVHIQVVLKRFKTFPPVTE
jgi:hypothetical protein